jgi:hypothetical protein
MALQVYLHRTWSGKPVSTPDRARGTLFRIMPKPYPQPAAGRSVPLTNIR